MIEVPWGEVSGHGWVIVKNLLNKYSKSPGRIEVKIASKVK